MSKIKIAPSLMCANFLNIKSELDIFNKNGIDLLHIDIMDGHYVPNLTLGIDFCNALVSYSSIPLDFHLMIENVDDQLKVFCSIPNSIITFHPETTRHPVRTIQEIRRLNCKPGIAIDPGTSVESLKHLFPLVDQVCVMSVNPGYAGQELLPFCIEKIKEVKTMLKQIESAAEIEVDGNVSWDNIPLMVNAGADILVLGTSSIFAANYTRNESITKLKDLLNKLHSNSD